MSPMREYVCDVCGVGPIERFEATNDMKPPMCEPCSFRMKRLMSTSYLQFYGEGAYASSRHGHQWRNQWGRDFRQKNEGENFKATDHIKTLTGSGVKEEV